MSKPVIGKILAVDQEYERDAIHVPIMSVVALEELLPGQKIDLKKMQRWEPMLRESFGASKAKTKASSVGIVDPYLKDPVKVGEKFYCWIKPSTVHKLWHEWEHPIFDAV